MPTPRAPSPIWRFGSCEFDTCTAQVQRGASRIRLPDRSAAVLEVLLEHAGELVTRDEICERLWGEHPVVDVEHGLNAAVSRLRGVLRDTPLHPRFIETIPRRGYRFVADCSRHDARAAAIRSVAVLPFDDLGDAGARRIADGLTEEVTTALSGLTPVRVVSRLSASAYRTARRPLAEVARELGADAVVEGAVLRGVSVLHVSTELLDVRSDSHLWAGRYSAPGSCVEAVTRLASTIAAEIARRLPPGCAGDAAG